MYVHISKLDIPARGSPKPKKKCPHGRQKSQCKPCGGVGICPHGIDKYRCIPCDGPGICVHKKRRTRRDTCTPQRKKYLCPHGRDKWKCIPCDGVGICKHKRLRSKCKQCGSEYACITDGCFSQTTKKNTKCKTCLPSANRLSRSGEIRIAAQLETWVKDGLLPLSPIWNRQNPDSDPVQCGRYRPDFRYELDLQQRVVLMEYDEHAHGHQQVSCELTRQMEIALGFGGCPVHFIRYNPDKVPGVSRPAKKECESLLLSRLQAALADAPSDDSRFKHILTVEYLYYYPIPGADTTTPHVQTFGFTTVPEYEDWALGVTKCGKSVSAAMHRRNAAMKGMEVEDEEEEDEE